VAGSFTRGDLSVDTGQHVFLRCCSAYRALLDRVGTTRRTTIQDRLDVQVLSRAGSYRLSRSRLPAPIHLAGSLARYRRLSPMQRYRAARCALALRRVDPRDPATDLMTFAQWLSDHGQSDEAVDALWDVIALPTLNLGARLASLAPAAKVFRTGLLDAAGAGDVGYPLAPLGEVHVAPVRRAIEDRGGRVFTRTSVGSISPTGAGFEVATSEGSVTADAVIVAVGHEALPRIAGLEWPDVTGLGSSPIVNLHLIYDAPVLDRDFVAVIDSPLQWVFDRTKQSGLENGQYVAVSLSAADEYSDLPTAELRAMFEPEIQSLFPRARRAVLEDFFVTREKQATFKAVPGTGPLRPGPTTSTSGVVLAGAYTDTGWPATMEGAVRSGHGAARAVLISLGRTKALPGVEAA
jgi:squalene-associated FAD-dependent desaturase